MDDKIKPYLINKLIVGQTADRIIADFSQWGLDIRFSGEEQGAYEELSEQLTPAIHHFLKNDRQKLMQVLYRIDISEQKLTAEIKKYPKTEMAEVITRLIIERELEKVLTRIAYKNKK